MTGAAALLGNVQVSNPTAGGLPLEPPPSMRQGWGRVNLAGALPLAGAAPGWRLQVRCRVCGHAHMCVRACMWVGASMGTCVCSLPQVWLGYGCIIPFMHTRAASALHPCSLAPHVPLP